MTRTSRLDVQIDGGLGFYQFSLLTRRAQAWVRHNVAREGWNGSPESFYSDDRQCAMAIAQGMINAGLRVK